MFIEKGVAEKDAGVNVEQVTTPFKSNPTATHQNWTSRPQPSSNPAGGRYIPHELLSKSPIRIGNISGATGDSPSAMTRMLSAVNDIQVITGDWLSEMNIAWNAITRRACPELGFENGFYEQLEQNLDEILARNIKVVTNAGALNTEALTAKVEALCKKRGHDHVKIAAVLGDDVSYLISDPARRKELRFPHLDHPDRTLDGWGLKPVCGSAYIGCRGIVAALDLPRCKYRHLWSRH